MRSPPLRGRQPDPLGCPLDPFGPVGISADVNHPADRPSGMPVGVQLEDRLQSRLGFLRQLDLDRQPACP